MQIINGYEGPDKIYESSRSRIYRARDENKKQPVVLKIFNKEYAAPEEVSKFSKEYDIINRFEDAGIVRAYKLFEIDNTPAIAMEDIGGRPLSEILETEKLTLDEFFKLGIRITDIIGNIHKHNIIHKDINPTNIVWNVETDDLQIIDFGLATELPREVTSVKNPRILEGTLAYISPEQTGRMNRSMDYRTDFYSLGVTFYWMLTSRLPFESSDMLKLIHSHIAILPLSPHEVDNAIPEAVSKIVMKLVAKNAEDRYLSAHGLKADLERCRQELQQKGRIEPFELGLQDVSDKFQIPQKLYGREQEINLLMSAFQSARQGSTEFMLVSGFSGIGKSVLINEIQKPIVQHRGYFISGKFEKLKKDVPYSALIQAMDWLARQILSEDQAEIDLWKEKLSAVLGPNGKIVTDLIPTFELILGKQPDVPVLGPIETQNRFNLVFQEFIKALADKEHPLVIFLDDLQWADLASLHLLKLFMTDSDLTYLLMIGAYRHNETSESHPLMLTLADIEEAGTTLSTLFLKPLNSDHVSQLLSDTMNRPREETAPLSELLVQKTNGNPFFINEFLKILYKESIIQFSFEKGWSWQTERIQEMQATDNVVDLMAGKISDLPQNSQDVLKLAACIGSFFNLRTLVTISEKSEQEIMPALHAVLQEGLLLKIDDIYRFSHDRILEAAYFLISEEEKIQQHYLIGKLELNTTGTNDLQEKIFYIANHLNAGVSLITDVSEKRILAELNLTAGKKALASNAYASALNYLNAGISLLGKKCWQETYDCTLALYQEATVAAQLNADYENMEKSANEVLNNGKTILDKIRVYEAMIFASMAKNQPMEAIKIGLNVLHQLGIKIPEKPSMLRILLGLINTKLGLIGKSIDRLIDQPEMTDPHQIVTLQILAGIGPPAYTAAPEIVPLVNFHAVRRSIKYGRAKHSPFFYGTFGFIHSGILGDIETGYKWGKLAQDLVEKYDMKMIKAKALMSRWIFINHTKMHLRDTTKELLETYKVGIETGDVETAGLLLFAYCLEIFLFGKSLAEVEKEVVNYADTIKKLNQDTYLTYQRLLHQFVLNLRGKSDDPCKLIGSSYDQDKMIPVHKEAKDLSVLCALHEYLCCLNYLFENYVKALECSDYASLHLESLYAAPNEFQYFFYDSLTRLALFPLGKRSLQKKYLRKVNKNQKKMKLWATHAPMNYGHKYHLVEAEKARVLGQEANAREHYSLAVKGAHENKYINEEALALELTAKFWLGLDEEKVASAYMREAHHAYHAWGATAKISQIEEKYGYLLKTHAGATIASPVKTTTATSATLDPTATGMATSEMVDLSTVMKTSQTLSSEIDLGRLLKTIMAFSIENAGAQRGFLIIENEEDGNLYIEAACEVGQEINVLKSVPMEKDQTLSSKIVSYVNRTGENVVLNNAHEQGNFTTDAYISMNKVKSLLCMPITHKGKTSGILYLENNLTTNSFTDERLELLRIVASQAAISIENARLLVHRENAAKLEKEMEIAANIQTGLLPKKPSIEGYEISAYMLPAEEVGGDYYDVINTAGRDWIIIGDVSGHGVPAGLVMMMVQTAIHVVLSQHPGLPPNELLTIVNKTITKNVKLMGEDKYMTITAFATHENGQFSFSGLHQDIMIYRHETGDVEILETEGFWMGLVDDVNNMMKDSGFSLQPGDTMLIYTDGITEALKKGRTSNKQDNLFGSERLRQIFSTSGGRHPDEIRDAIIKALKEYECKDDVTMVILKRV